MRDQLKWSEGVVRLAARRKAGDLVGLRQRFEYLGQTLFMLTEANKDASNQSIKFHSELKWHDVATMERVTQRQVSTPWEQMSISELFSLKTQVSPYVLRLREQITEASKQLSTGDKGINPCTAVFLSWLGEFLG